MPDRFLREDITKQERSAFFHMLELGFLKTTFLVALIVSVVVATAIAIPVAVIVNNNTDHVNKTAHNINCDHINAIDNALIGVIVVSPTMNDKQVIQKADLLKKLRAARCKKI